MDFLSYLNVSFVDLERELIERWSEQYHQFSFEEFVEFLEEKKVWVEMILYYSQLFKVAARTKYASIHFLFRYLKQRERSKLNKNENVALNDLHLICLTCLQLSCKRYQSFAMDVNSLVDNMKNRFKKSDFFDGELDILKTLDFNANCTVIFDFIELYLACFWTIVPKILEIKANDLRNLSEEVTDLMYQQPRLLLSANIKSISCFIIAAASTIATGLPKRSSALVSWLSQICKEKERNIKEGSNKIMTKLFGELVAGDLSFDPIAEA